MSDALGRIPQEARGLQCDAMADRMAFQSPRMQVGGADKACVGPKPC